MQTLQKSLRIPKWLAGEISRIETEEQKDFSTTANALLEEAVKMRRCPGIVFAEGTRGRRARIAGTGLEVWEVVATYRHLQQNMRQLRAAYHWLTKAQSQAAIGYAEAYPQEINHIIQQNESWTPEKLKRIHPTLTR